ncbi:MAG: DEAD/DEAH box helicase [Corynebacterium sp.]|nr:DEAD/DEAH box helicase [Corynebacterium sp.]
MSALSPINGSTSVFEGIVEYLTTTMVLADSAAASAFKLFLSNTSGDKDSEQGIFRGPFIRTPLPYETVPEGRGPRLQFLPDSRRPYKHQELAFSRLRSAEPDGTPCDPQPTAVVTGTGSGKTEAFLYPILDHCVRERMSGHRGPKAIILYPMNALANDQASRLEELLSKHENPAFRSLRVGLYVGESSDADGQTPVYTHSDDSVIVRSREEIRETNPDILLTNYKMLDLILHRVEDTVVEDTDSESSAESLWVSMAKYLRYIVLDEAHSYTGPQGTDVAMLLRRVGLKVRNLREDLGLPVPDKTDRLCGIVPVATSATMGSQGQSELLEYLSKLTGVRFVQEMVVEGTQVPLAAWTKLSMESFVGKQALTFWKQNHGHDFDATVREVCEKMRNYSDVGDEAFNRQVNTVMADCLNFDYVEQFHAGTVDEVKKNPWLCRLYSITQDFSSFDKVIHDYFGPGMDPVMATNFMRYLIAWAANIRATMMAGKYRTEAQQIPGVQVHMWIRELSRIERELSHTVNFRWADDNAGVDDNRRWLPAIHCRHCGRSGWYVGGSSEDVRHPELDPTIIRQATVARGPITPCALIHAREEEIRAVEKLEFERIEYGITEATVTTGDSHYFWLDATAGTLHTVAERIQQEENSAGSTARWIPVKAFDLFDLPLKSNNPGTDRFANTCPSCGVADQIRYMGSAVTTLLSVAVTTLFGMSNVDEDEKKALVFADSIQDAAHRAGYVEDRSYSFGFRTSITEAIANGAHTFEDIATHIVDNASSPSARYALLPPDLLSDLDFESLYRRESTNWERSNGLLYYQDYEIAESLEKIKKRLAFDTVLEFGRRSYVGRTLTLTGVADVEVTVDDQLLLQAAYTAWEQHIGIFSNQELENIRRGTDPESATTAETDAMLTAWARGIIERIRIRGGISHPWLNYYRMRECNGYVLSGKGRRRDTNMPPFGRGQEPYFPLLHSDGSKTAGRSTNYGVEPMSTTESWYIRWTMRALHTNSSAAQSMLKTLVATLINTGVLDYVEVQPTSKADAQHKRGTVGIPMDNIRIRLADEREELGNVQCDTCKQIVPITGHAAAQLEGAPCFQPNCPGHFEIYIIPNNFYKALYSASKRTRIIAREHSSVIDASQRRELEASFSEHDSSKRSPEAPNVLVATPTLEMGINIGDLSMVLLSSLPRTTASYVQRAGRAGRITGNSLVISVLRGRGHALSALEDPLRTTIAGEVNPPAIFLDAPELIRRQAFASMIDNSLPRMGRRPASYSTQAFLNPKSQQWGLAECLEAYPESDRYFRDFLDSLGDYISPGVYKDIASWDYIQELRNLRKSWIAEQRRASQTKNQTLAQAHIRQQEANHLGSMDIGAVKYEEAQLLYSMATALQNLINDAKANWAGAFVSLGLMPNYTLVDRPVRLQLLGKTENQRNDGFATVPAPSENIDINSAMVLHELAPGSVYYARGRRIEIDAVTVNDPENPIRTLVLCRSCSYSEEQSDTPPKACPSCGDRNFPARENTIEFVDLREARAIVDYQRNYIGGSEEQRKESYYKVHTSVVLPAEKNFLEGYSTPSGFKVAFAREARVRALNLGRVDSSAPKRRHNGQDFNVTLFKVCSECGKQDTKADVNGPEEHYPNCKHAHSSNQAHNKSIALSRNFKSQAVVFYLPPSFNSDVEGLMPSLMAALRLGFDAVLNGAALDEVHMARMSVRARPEFYGASGEEAGVASHTSPYSNASLSGSVLTESALVMYDTVPGGTGYLETLTSPEVMHKVLLSAVEKLCACDCDDPSSENDTYCCANCLLPFAQPQFRHITKRTLALKLLLELLLRPNQIPESWDFESIKKAVEQEKEPAQPEQLKEDFAQSNLEQAFQELLMRLVSAKNASVQPFKARGHAASRTNYSIRFRGEGTSAWSLTQEVRNGFGSQADFELLSDPDPKGRRVRFMIFCDSSKYHAFKQTASGHWRLSDDAEKRNSIMGAFSSTGDLCIPWAITMNMVNQAEKNTKWFEQDFLKEHEPVSDTVVETLKVVLSRHAEGVTIGSIEDCLTNPILMLVDMLSSLDKSAGWEQALRLWQNSTIFATRLYMRVSQQIAPLLFEKKSDYLNLQMDFSDQAALMATDRSAVDLGMCTTRLSISQPADADEKTRKEFLAAWQAWLTLSNLFALLAPLGARCELRTVESAQPVQQAAPEQPAASLQDVEHLTALIQNADEHPVRTDQAIHDAQTAQKPAAEPPAISAAWAAAIADTFEGFAIAICEALAANDYPCPTVGYEYGVDNTPIELAWTDMKIAVYSQANACIAPSFKDELVAAGWQVFINSSDDELDADLLPALTAALRPTTPAVGLDRALAALLNTCVTPLERELVLFADAHNLPLPTMGADILSDMDTPIDVAWLDAKVAVYPADNPEITPAIVSLLESHGWTVLENSTSDAPDSTVMRTLDELLRR